jgi:hypothetical protein
MKTFTTIKTIQVSDLTININKHCSNLINNWWELEVVKVDEPIANFVVEESDFYDTGYSLYCYEGDCDQDLIWDSVYFPLVHLIGREQYFKTIKNLDGKAPYKVNAYTIAVAEFVKEQFDFNYIENLKDEFLDLINLDLVEDEDGKYKYLAMPWWQTGDHEGEYAIWAEVLEDNTANATKVADTTNKFVIADDVNGIYIQDFLDGDEKLYKNDDIEAFVEDLSSGDKIAIVCSTEVIQAIYNAGYGVSCEVSEYRYCTRDSEAGNIIDFFATLEDAQKAIEQYEEEDKDNGDFTPGFYEIYNQDTDEIVE